MKLPSFETFASEQLGKKMNPQQSSTNTIDFDPCKLMTDRNNMQDCPTMPEVKEWDVEDIKKLEEFCAKHGILGFNFGRMNPKLALAMLKNRMGDYSDVSLKERTPSGYLSMNPIKSKDLLCG